MDGSSSFHGFQVGAASSTTVTTTNNGNGQCTVREQDRFMPIANVIRIMRRVLPPHAKISDDAKETIQECVSEFISFITGEANDRCQREQRKTVTAEDVLWAMNKLGFDDYVEPLTSFLQGYREAEVDHRGSIRGEPLGPRMGAAAEMANLPVGVTANGSGDPLYGIHYHNNHYHNQHGFGFFGNNGEHVTVAPPGYYFGMHAAALGNGNNGDHGNGGGGRGATASTQHHTAAMDPYNNN